VTPSITCTLSVRGPLLQVSCTVPPTVKHSALLIIHHGKHLVATVRARVRDHRVTVRLRTHGMLRGKGRTTVTLSLPSGVTTVKAGPGA
jgi:hypothetical protein